jgi:hypothetical protein
MKTLIEKQRNVWIKKFHVLIREAGIDNDTKLAMLATYGVKSSTELDLKELINLCDTLDRMIHPEEEEMDIWRKRLIAAIYGWRKAMGSNATTMEEVKAIACRAAGKSGEKGFHRIPLERLRSLYYAFLKKEKDLSNVEEMTVEETDYRKWSN